VMEGSGTPNPKSISRWRGLRTKIITWSFVPTAIILLAVVVVTFLAFQRVTEELVLERDLEVTFVSASQLAADLREYENLLAGVTRTIDLGQIDPTARPDALKHASNRLVVFDGGVLLLDAFGKVVAAEPERPQILGQDWIDRSYFQNVVRSQITSTSPQMIVSNIVNDGADGAAVIACALPILNSQSQFQGVLVGLFRVSPSSTNALYGDIIRLRIGESGSTYLVDGEGRVIYHSDVASIGQDFSAQTVVQQVLSGQVSSVRTRDPAGNDVVAGFAPVPDTSWGLVNEESWGALTSGFRSYQNFLLFLLVLGVVIPAIVVNLGVRRITRPITELMSAAQEVAQGKFGQTIRAQTGDEIEELAQQFNLMSAQLQASYANLEQKVADRTRELATLNAVAAVVSRSLELDEILTDALEQTVTMLDVDAGAILLIQPDGEVMTAQVQRGFSEEFLEAVPHIRRDEGLAGQAVTQGEPVVLDISEYPTEHLAPLLVKEGLQTLVSAPLLHKGRALGVLNLATRRPRAFPSQELELLAAIGQQIGVAVENAQLYEQTEQELAERKRAEEELRRVNEVLAHRNRELLLLNRVIAATTSQLEIKAVLEAVCRELALAFDLPEVGAALLDLDGSAAEPTLTVVAEYRTADRPSALGTVLPVRGNPSAEYVLEHKAPMAVTDAQRDPRMAPVHDLMRQRNNVSLLILPLTVHDEVVGTIGLVAVERREFTAEEVNLAANAAAAASQALENARAEEALRDSQQRLLLHVQHTPLAYIEWDADLQVVDWNPAAERIFGYSRKEALHCHAYEIIVPPEVQPRVTEIWHSILDQTGGTRSTNENVTKDGRRITCEWYNTPLIDQDGRVIGLASLVEDITERVRAEEELRQAKESAETANRAKSVFLANMSHELRTPLNAILGFAQLMTRDPGLTSAQRENLDIIGRSGEHLLGLINDVLETSKIEAGRATLEAGSFDLYRMLDGLEEMFQLRATQKGLVLLFERGPGVPQYVCTDESKLRQVLMNLLGNAVKFTQEGGITLRVGKKDARPLQEVQGKSSSVTPGDHTSLIFEVEDTGPGIAPTELEAVFDPFVQTESGKRSQEGTGLGLPISRQFVHLMGGELTVSSEVGVGSIFRFEVQFERADPSDVLSARPTQRVVGLEPDQPHYRLLVVEDRDPNRRLLVNLLAPLGFEVREAANGREAIEVWERWEPHLIWMDLRMPVMDGHEAIKRIKSTAQGQATVIIALTASAFEEDRSLILSEGCNDFIRKPFREEEIFEKLTRHLGVRFVYEEIGARGNGRDERPDLAKAPAAAGLSPADMATLPAVWVAKLRQAATQLDSDISLNLIDQIRKQNASMADALAALVRDFRFDVIMALTKPLENEREP
jgi:PAS domain S-box-containing protein